MLFSEIDDAYLLWLQGNYHGYDRKHIEKELKRRGY
jgi:hypothetical protein